MILYVVRAYSLGNFSNGLIAIREWINLSINVKIDVCSCVFLIDHPFRVVVWWRYESVVRELYQIVNPVFRFDS